MTPWPFQGPAGGATPDEATIEAVALLVKRAAKLAFKHGFLVGFCCGITAATAACLWALLL